MDSPKDQKGKEFPYEMSFAGWFVVLQKLSKSTIWQRLAGGLPLKSTRPKEPLQAHHWDTKIGRNDPTRLNHEAVYPRSSTCDPDKNYKEEEHYLNRGKSVDVAWDRTGYRRGRKDENSSDQDL